MKTGKLSLAVSIGALFVVVGANAVAGERDEDQWLNHIVSTKTREQVIAEMGNAQSQGQSGAGESYRGETGYTNFAAPSSGAQAAPEGRMAGHVMEGERDYSSEPAASSGS